MQCGKHLSGREPDFNPAVCQQASITGGSVEIHNYVATHRKPIAAPAMLLVSRMVRLWHCEFPGSDERGSLLLQSPALIAGIYDFFVRQSPRVSAGVSHLCSRRTRVAQRRIEANTVPAPDKHSQTGSAIKSIWGRSSD